jgi:asparagine synthetase B (glutamine-hydrolysing)
MTTQDKRRIASLLRRSRIRGLHSFGVWALSGDQVVFERSLEYRNIIKTIYDLPLNRETTVIAHNRYSTSGDWRKIENAQPLYLAGIAMAFNGVITMQDKAIYSRNYDYEFETGNDGEIFLRHIQNGVNAVQFILDMPGSFAGIWHANGTTYIGRNSRRPLWYYLNEGRCAVASTKQILHCASAAELPEGVFEIEALKRDRPGAEYDQQDGQLFGIPPSYDECGRYRPRISGVALFEQQV